MLRKLKIKLIELKRNPPKVGDQIDIVRAKTARIAYEAIATTVHDMHQEAVAKHEYDCACIKLAISEIETQNKIAHAHRLIEVNHEN